MLNNSKKNAIIYTRVSTSKQYQTGDSPKDQDIECRHIVERLNLNVVPDDKAFTDAISGSGDDRPALNDAMEYLRTHPGEVSYFIFKDISRLTRGGSSAYEKIKSGIESYGVELIEGQGIILPKRNTLEDEGFRYDNWSVYSPSEGSELLMAEQGKSSKRDILTRLIKKQIHLTNEGYQIGPPNDGYENKKVKIDGKYKTIQIPNEERAKYFREMFKLRAEGLLDDKEITDKINAMGFRTPKRARWNGRKHEEIIGYSGNNPLSVKQLQRLIQKPIYCGVVCEKWTHNKPIKARYDGLVDIVTFNKANNGKIFIKESKDSELEILNNLCPEKVLCKRNKFNPLFPNKGIILCPECGKPLLGSSPRGKSGKGFPTYHCSRGGHKYIGIRKNYLDSLVKSTIENLGVDTRVINALEVILKNTYKQKSNEIAEYKEEVENNVNLLKQKQQESIDTLKKIKSDTVRKKLEEEVDKLEDEITKVEKQKLTKRINPYDISQFINYAKSLMEHKEEMLLNNENIQEKAKLFSLVFDESPTYTDLVNGTLKLSLIFHNKRELASASSPIVVPRGIEPLLTG